MVEEIDDEVDQAGVWIFISVPLDFVENPGKNEERYLVIDHEKIVIDAVGHHPHVIVMDILFLVPPEEELDDEAPVEHEHLGGVAISVAAVAPASLLKTISLHISNIVFTAHIALPLKEALEDLLLVRLHVEGADLVTSVIRADGDHPGLEQALVVSLPHVNGEPDDGVGHLCDWDADRHLPVCHTERKTCVAPARLLVRNERGMKSVTPQAGLGYIDTVYEVYMV